MAKLLTSRQMMAADRRTIDDLGLPGIVLMENAGAALTHTLLERMPGLRERRVVVVAGTGNNGGDGFVVARRLFQEGIRVRVFLLGHGESLKGDARTNHDVCRKLGVRIRELTDDSGLEGLRSALGHAAVVVDAVFGTGLQREVTGLFARVFDLINELGKPVLAVDLPSGVSADDGRILGSAVRATWTVTFAAEKIAHRTWPGAGYCGEVICHPIGIPQAYLDSAEHAVELNRPEGLEIPPRPGDGHKGRFGHLLILAGSLGKTGAAVLTARGALRTGPGLVTVALPRGAQRLVARELVEAMTLPLDEDEAGIGLGAGAMVGLRASGLRPQALAIGPGLGTGPGAGAAVRALVQDQDVPAVLDADALNLLTAEPEDLLRLARGRRSPLVITPHPGEMSRLTGLTVPEIQADRLAVARRQAQAWGVWVVLKGAGTVIAAPDGRAWINATGHSGLGAGGSGDLLTGIIAGFLTQGWPVASAVRAGVWIHGAAAEAAAADSGPIGLVASDLLPHLQRLRNRLG
ncbi:MAG: NAD(P)H-hydrate dehydratase [Magnetococcales bacterium]|nr:NAD(P)H-hydrate dehydratase [Magnetococcales bacterium]